MPAPKSIRWTIKSAQPEFKTSNHTLTTRLKSAGVLPGEDGKYSTFQIHDALSGGKERRRGETDALEQEILREKLKRLQKDKYESREEFERDIKSVFLGLRQIVLNSNLPKELQDELLANLQRGTQV